MKPLQGIVLLAALSALICLTGCGNRTTTEPRTITIVGRGSVQPKPDLLILQLGVASRAASLETAQTNASRKMQAALAALQKVGVKSEEIQTTDYSVDRYTEKPRRGASRVMYRVYDAVSVRTVLVDKAGKIVDTMVHLGLNSISGPSFGLKDEPAARRDAMELAFKNAQQDAERLAKAGGMRLAGIGKLSTGDGYEGYNGMDVLAEGLSSKAKLGGPPMPGSPPMPMASGRVRVSASVTVSFRVE